MQKSILETLSGAPLVELNVEELANLAPFNFRDALAKT